MKKHYIRFFSAVLIFGLLTSSICYAAENDPFQTVSDPGVKIEDIIPVIPQVEPEPEKDPDPDPIIEPEPVYPEELVIVEPSSGVSENDVSENSISNNEPAQSDPADSGSNEISPGNNSADESSGSSPSFIINVDNASDREFYLTSVSADNVKIQYLDTISKNIIDIKEILKRYERDQKNFNSIISGVSENETAFQKDLLEYLLFFKNNLSGNKVQIDPEEIKVNVSFNGVSEDMVHLSENDVEETVSEDIVSDNAVSDNSVSKGDIDQLHEDNVLLHNDLRMLFYLGLFSVIFMAMLVASQLEQIIFKRLRG